ncbi:MAG: alkaline phosphatase family protein [Gemmatimonas sp.]
MYGLCGGAHRNSQGHTASGRRIMECFTPEQLPALSTLAREFAICDFWFSSIPGPTWPNRLFVHCATSGGFVVNRMQQYYMPTIFEALESEGHSWRVYFHDVPQALASARLRRDRRLQSFAKIDKFYHDASAGTLPAYSFIEPQYFNFLAWKANDQHGGHSMAQGDTLIAHVYEALRANDAAWPHTLLVIEYDEHGGFFDHVSPPYDGLDVEGQPVAIPNPDSVSSAAPTFDFQRLGVRVPAVVVSPWIARGTVDHRIRDHCAVPATLRRVFRLPRSLTLRDAVISSVEDLATLPAMRTDTPTVLPRNPQINKTREFELRTLDVERAPEAALPRADGPGAREPLNDLQRSLLELVDSLDPVLESRIISRAADRETEESAAADARRKMDTILARGADR